MMTFRNELLSNLSHRTSSTLTNCRLFVQRFPPEVCGPMRAKSFPQVKVIDPFVVRSLCRAVGEQSANRANSSPAHSLRPGRSFPLSCCRKAIMKFVGCGLAGWYKMAGVLEGRGPSSKRTKASRRVLFILPPHCLSRYPSRCLPSAHHLLQAAASNATSARRHSGATTNWTATASFILRTRTNCKLQLSSIPYFNLTDVRPPPLASTNAPTQAANTALSRSRTLRRITTRSSECTTCGSRGPKLIFISSLKLRIKCTIDPECDAELCDAASLIRHEKRRHGYFRKENEYRPVEPVARKPRTKKSNTRETTVQPAQDELVVMQSFEPLCLMPSASSPWSLSSHDSPLDFFSPSPSPDLPTPGASQLDFPQYPIYPDASAATMPVDTSIAFDSTVYDTQSFDSFADLSLSGLSAPEFVQGCSSYSAIPFSIPTNCYVSQPPFDADMGSYDLFPSTPSEAKEEWLSLFPEPSLETSPSHPNSIYPSSTPAPNNVANSIASDFGFSNINSDFDQFMQELGMDDAQTWPF